MSSKPSLRSVQHMENLGLEVAYGALADGPKASPGRCGWEIVSQHLHLHIRR